MNPSTAIALGIPSAPLAVRKPVPAEGLLHPLVLFSVALMLANDHLLKAAWPGWWTGKLSDFAGLAFFPLFLVALVELGQAALGRFRAHFVRDLWVAAGLTAAVFTAVQLWPLAGDAYRIVWGGLYWPLKAIGALAQGDALPGLHPVSLTQDPTDLLALPAVLLGPCLAWWSIRGRAREPLEAGP